MTSPQTHKQLSDEWKEDQQTQGKEDKASAWSDDSVRGGGRSAEDEFKRDDKGDPYASRAGKSGRRNEMMVDKYDVKRDDIAEDINEDKTTSSKPVVINVPSTGLTLPTISMPSADSRAARIVQGSIVHTIKGFGKGAIIGMIVGELR